MQLQQCLPFTVLKHIFKTSFSIILCVATVLTVYGIETMALELACEVATYELQQCLPFTVLKLLPKWLQKLKDTNVATVLTVYGIETIF